MARSSREETDQLTRVERSALLHHVARLRLPDPDAYRAWCSERGLSPKLVKPEHQRRKEIELRDNESVSSAMARSRTARKDPGRMLDRIFVGDIEHADLAPDYQTVARLVAAFGKRRRAESIARFRELFLIARDRTKLISAAPVVAAYPRDVHNTYLGALAAVAAHGPAWLRPLDEWKVDSKNVRRQFGSLVRHLFAQYPLPRFLDTVWFRRSRAQNWFLHVGRGASIRQAERLFFPMTRREAHEFMQAPDDYTVEQAFRWAQIHALNGNRPMADAICGTRLGNRFEHHGFWMSVLRFFVRNPFLDRVHYGPIIDYIQNQKFETREVFVRPGVIEQQPPPHPGFTMQGRTPEALLRQVGAWHLQLGREQRAGPSQWKPSGIGGLSVIEGGERSQNMRRWIITELLDRDSLISEGRAMRHCVASYARSCASAQSSLWSMQCETEEGRERVLTIEIKPSTRAVVQARGRFNAPPTPQALRILRRWTEKEALTVAGYIEL